MILTEFHKSLLKRIKGGEKIFAPAGDAGNKMEVFQTEAEALIELEQSGLITLKAIHHESRSVRRLYDLIVVDALTQTGRKAPASKF